MSKEKKDKGFPYIEAPFTEPVFGQPESLSLIHI